VNWTADTPAGPRGAGFSLVELLAAVAAGLAVGAIALPQLGVQRDRIVAAGAARHLASRVCLTRAESLKRGVHVGMAFQPAGASIRYGTFADGNRNGVRSADVTQGVDRQVAPWETLNDHFPGAALGILPQVTDPDTGAPLGGSPLRLGGGSLLSFGPTGGATSGTLYVRGAREQQYAIRILGATGRSRILRFDFPARRWLPL
jgi:type II secretory pathway pseudopilin PulG